MLKKKVNSSFYCLLFDGDKNWLEEKDKTPFGCLPVLYINKGDKVTLHAIDIIFLHR